MLKKNGPGHCCCSALCPKINGWENVSVDATITVTETLPQSLLINPLGLQFTCENRYDSFCIDADTSIPSTTFTRNLVCNTSFYFWSWYESFKVEPEDWIQAYWGGWEYHFHCTGAWIETFITLLEYEVDADPTMSYMVAEIRFGADADVDTADDALPIIRCTGGVFEIIGETYLVGRYRSDPYTHGTGSSVVLSRIDSGHDTDFRFGKASLPSTITAYSV